MRVVIIEETSGWDELCHILIKVIFAVDKSLLSAASRMLYFQIISDDCQPIYLSRHTFGNEFIRGTY